MSAASDRRDAQVRADGMALSLIETALHRGLVGWTSLNTGIPIGIFSPRQQRRIRDSPRFNATGAFVFLSSEHRDALRANDERDEVDSHTCHDCGRGTVADGGTCPQCGASS